jgi:hypothetical protein
MTVMQNMLPGFFSIQEKTKKPQNPHNVNKCNPDWKNQPVKCVITTFRNFFVGLFGSKMVFVAELDLALNIY